MPQCLNASMPQCHDASMPRCLDASMPQCHDASMRVRVRAAAQDLDPALLSRFDVRVAFPLPDAAARASIIGRYARAA
eukprot:2119099-Prymnesium_polylepis.1